jgi:hypothetical protein
MDLDKYKIVKLMIIMMVLMNIFFEDLNLFYIDGYGYYVVNFN